MRKINTAGTITTIAGTGNYGYNGDNIPATAANISAYSIKVDNSGNIYLADRDFNRIRKVNTAGIISTVVGNGIGGFGGDNGNPLLANLFNPEGVAIDRNNNIYIADTYNARIREVRYNVGIGAIDHEQKPVTIFPNPSAGEFTLLLPSAASTYYSVAITDVLGREVKRIETPPANEIHISLDVPDGIYYLSVVTPGSTYAEKVIIRH